MPNPTTILSIPLIQGPVQWHKPSWVHLVRYFLPFQVPWFLYRDPNASLTLLQHPSSVRAGPRQTRVFYSLLPTGSFTTPQVLNECLLSQVAPKRPIWVSPELGKRSSPKIATPKSHCAPQLCLAVGVRKRQTGEPWRALPNKTCTARQQVHKEEEW